MRKLRLCRAAALTDEQRLGSWIIDDQPLDEGDSWQEWPAYHRVTRGEHARIRFLVSPPGTSVDDQRRI